MERRVTFAADLVLLLTSPRCFSGSCSANKEHREWWKTRNHASRKKSTPLCVRALHAKKNHSFDRTRFQHRDGINTFTWRPSNAREPIRAGQLRFGYTIWLYLRDSVETLNCELWIRSFLQTSVPIRSLQMKCTICYDLPRWQKYELHLGTKYWFSSLKLYTCDVSSKSWPSIKQPEIACVLWLEDICILRFRFHF